MIISSINELANLLYTDLGYSPKCADTISTFGTINPSIIKTIYPFIMNFQGKKAVMTDDILDAFELLFDFLPLSKDLLSEIKAAVISIKANLKTLPDNLPPITEKAQPVAYFLSKAKQLPGFSVLALAGRDLILTNKFAAIPPLLVACTSLPEGIKHYHLTSEDILLSVDKHLHKNGKSLALNTRKGYRRLLRKLLRYQREIYGKLHYGSYALIAESESQENNLEDLCRKKYYMKIASQGIDYIASSHVLRPVTLKQILLVNLNRDAFTHEIYSECVFKLIATIMFHFSSRLQDLLKLRIIDYDRAKNIIVFHITEDRLNHEDTVYIPLHYPFMVWINQQLDYRKKIANIEPQDPLFCLCSGGIFKPVTDKDMKSYFALMSRKTGETITDIKIYRTHLTYYDFEGKINPIITNRIGNRHEPLVIIPRLYTQTSLFQQRHEHYAAFCRVNCFLSISCGYPCFNDRTEMDIKLGGRRAPGRDTIKLALAYLSETVSLYDRTICLVFILNYFCGSRVAELLSLTLHSIDIMLDIIKFRTKDTLSRSATTKVLPLHSYVKQALLAYISLP